MVDRSREEEVAERLRKPVSGTVTGGWDRRCNAEVKASDA
jgi:hypothetical protein